MSSFYWVLGMMAVRLDGLVLATRIYYPCRGVLGTFVVNFYWKEVFDATASAVIYTSLNR